MFNDALLKVSAAQQVTADAASSSCIDLGDTTVKRQIGTGEAMGFLVTIKANGTTSGSAVFQAICSAANTLGTPTVCGQISLATADLAAGKSHFVPITMALPNLRYLGLYYDITGTVDFTVDAYLMPRDLASVAVTNYSKGYNV